MSTVTRFLLIPLCLWDCARSWLGYVGGRAPEKEWMWVHAWGWTGPDMAEHWQRVRDNPHDWEARKNLVTEWVRLSPERGGKVFSLAVVGLFVGGLVGWLLAVLAWI